MTRQGFGGLSMTIVKRLLRCQRLDTCGLDFLEDPRAQGLPLRALASHSGVSLRFVAKAAAWSRPPARRR
ncbi:hypothetical protein CSW58_12295 [Caulobacter sp. B11]|nr:hypothetical protein CSW58_12295 [Caulobacter sp. B11]